jgi:hypothetical protein
MMTVVNNGASTLIAPHLLADGTLQIKTGDGVRFGNTFPMRVTVQDPATGALTIFKVTGKTLDALTIGGTDEGTADQAFPVGALVENRWTAGAVAELPHADTPNVFTAGQTVHAHAAFGPTAQLDGPNPVSGLPQGPSTLYVVDSWKPGASAPQSGQAIYCSMTADHLAGPGNQVFSAIFCQGYVPPTVTESLYSVAGTVGYVTHKGAGPVGFMTGMDAEAYNSGGGAVTNFHGLYVYVENDTPSKVTNLRGIWLDTPWNDGQVDNAFGLWIGDHSGTGSVESWNIYSDGPASRNFLDGVVAIGTKNPDPSAKLEVDSTLHGVLLPRMTTAQRDGIASPAEGLIIYNLTTHKLNIRTASAWEAFTSA